MTQRTTISDIAEASGVSPATVSRVLNGHPRVKSETRERVQQAIREFEYRPNGAGRTLRRQRSDLWAVLVPDVRNPFFHRLVESFEEVAYAHGYAVMLCNTNEDLSVERSAINAVIGHQVSGALVAAVSASRSTLSPLQLENIPVVSIDRRVQGFYGDAIDVDNRRIGRMAADHLLEQGWREPLVVSHCQDRGPLLERERGFAEAMAQAGCPLPSARRVQVPFRSEEAASEIALRVQDPTIDAVFTTTNTLTAHAFRALKDRGRVVGEEVALIGVDDDRWNAMVDPPITVIEQPAEHLGRWAGELLLGRCKGNDATPARMVLDPELIVRGSTVPGGVREGAVPGRP